MNYLKLYIKICRVGEKRTNLSKKDTEKHHIFPVSIYGKNKRTVSLTIREHYVCHVLLMKAFRKRYGKHHSKYAKMAMAVHKMVYRLAFSEKIRFTSRDYLLARRAAQEAKTGKQRLDLLGKVYFGASEERIKSGIEKMVEKKTGMKINYPKNRKSRGAQTMKTKNKIKETKKTTMEKYKLMSQEEFINWMNKYNMYMVDGRRNNNITRAILARNEDIETYYK
jgi:hypothetical protein